MTKSTRTKYLRMYEKWCIKNPDASLEKYREYLLKLNYNNKYINQILSTISNYHNGFTEKELSQLYQYTSNRYSYDIAVILSIMIETGMRIKKILNLTKGDALIREVDEDSVSVLKYLYTMTQSYKENEKIFKKCYNTYYKMFIKIQKFLFPNKNLRTFGMLTNTVK